MKQIVLGSNYAEPPQAGRVSVIAMLALVAAVGCGGGGANAAVKTGGDGKVGGKDVAKEQPGGAPVTKEAADAFTQATLDFKQNEEGRSWDDAKCTARPCGARRAAFAARAAGQISSLSHTTMSRGERILDA